MSGTVVEEPGRCTPLHDREAAIRIAGARMQAAMRMACTPGADYAHHRSMATAHLAHMTALINSRSDDEIARLERERGLV